MSLRCLALLFRSFITIVMLMQKSQFLRLGNRSLRFRTANDKWVSGKIPQVLGLRSYLVTTSLCQQFRRNRRDIKVSCERPPIPSLFSNGVVRPVLPCHAGSELRVVGPHTGVIQNQVTPVEPPGDGVSSFLGSREVRMRSGRAIKLPNKFKDFTKTFTSLLALLLTEDITVSKFKSSELTIETISALSTASS